MFDVAEKVEGMGFYFRHVAGILLFGVRGSLRALAPAPLQVNMIETRKREHSRKPDEQYPFIGACSPGPFLEMFSRHARNGWTLWGDEADEEIAPRGKAHPGYGDGDIEAPAQGRYERLDGEVAEGLGEQLRAFYETGFSVRGFQKITGYSNQRVRGLLERAGADLSPRGGAH